MFCDAGFDNNNLKEEGRGRVVTQMFDDEIVGNEFELQSSYCVHFHTNAFGKGSAPLIPNPNPYPSSYELSSTTTVLLQGLF